MRLDLRFLNRPLGDIWCQAVVVFVIQKSSMTSDVLFHLNEKMGGSLVDILNKGLWTGDRGENFLFATQDAIKAGKLLLRGLGTEESFGIEVLKKEASETGAILDKININEFGIHISKSEGRENEYGSFLETAATSLVETFYNTHRDDPDYLLKLFFSIGKDFMHDLDPVVSRLKGSFGPLLEFSIITDRQSKMGLEVI